MDDLDLDAFIANIEETAPEDSLGAKLTCMECGVQLEEQDDGNYTCPGCSAQATNILQMDETELHHDDQGRPVYGQRVLLTEKRSKHQIDYGWAWSTDEAVAHIMSLQIDALEKAKLLPEFFRDAISNMWLKFWLENVAPHIKDEYNDNELVSISSRKALKLRDVEVLVKVRDKVMIPYHLMQRHQNARAMYKMYGNCFYSKKPDEINGQEIFDLGDVDSYGSSCGNSSTNSSLGDCEPLELDEQQFDGIQSNNGVENTNDSEQNCDQAGPSAREDSEAGGDVIEPKNCTFSTRNLGDESIAILTLNRTLAFIEATARCLKQNDPMFAADIIRACNQRLIPFYGASKLIPEGMKLNMLDRVMFQKTKPPTPIQLTRTASLLIHKIYRDQLPISLPVPDLSTILERFIKDLNLPFELYDRIKDQYSFADFRYTRDFIFTANVKRRLPQYDRWAYAVLLCHLKKLFNLSDRCVRHQSQRAKMKSLDDNENYFIISDWLHQLSIKLKLILRYDPFVLYHPLAELDNLEATPQMSKYIELILDDRTSSTIRTYPNLTTFEESYRLELSEFIKREMPMPKNIDERYTAEEDLDISSNVKYPFTDAIDRTQRFWIHEFENDNQVNDLIFKNFTTDKLLLPDALPKWCIYDNGINLTRWHSKISPDWPYAFRLLLHIGAFLCFCDPVELLNEVRLIDEYFCPEARSINRLNSSKNKS